MEIRRVQYGVDYIHILTFREEYKQILLPYFGFDGLRYGIDNENTINESIRLVFPNESIVLSVRKDGITLFFDGNHKELLNQNGISKIFWEIYDKIKMMQGFKNPTQHTLVCHAVKILEKEEVEDILVNNKYFTLNPFGKLNEFGCNYEYSKDSRQYKFQFGNYSEKDIKKHELRFLDSVFNDDLKGGVGLMAKCEIIEKSSSPNFSKFKSLISNTERILAEYKL
jgi:hypothetical protein